MIWNTIDFICREAALHLRRERLIAIATISTVAVLILVLGSMVLFLINLRIWTQRFGEELEVSAYFERDFPRDEAEEITDRVAKWQDVQSAKFVPKEESWEWLKSNMASGATLSDLDNPLPDRISVRAKVPEQLAAIAGELQEIEGIEDVVPSAEDAGDQGGFIHRVVQAKRIVTWSGVFIACLVILAGVFIVHNTIRLALHSRWREIYIMQLIGATRAVIAAPFLLEGMVHGSLGAALAACVILPLHMYLRALSAKSAPFMTLAPDTILIPFGIGILASGAILGLTGSAVSVRRYLRRNPGWHG